MSAPHAPSHDKAARRFWLRQEIVLGTLAAFLAFGLIYTYTGDVDLYYPFAGALSMGAATYAAVWLAARGKF